MAYRPVIRAERRRRALDLNIEVCEPETFSGKFVESWRRGTADNSAAIETRFAPPEIVHEHQDDIRLVLRYNRQCEQD
jgi:hypothetical protein